MRNLTLGAYLTALSVLLVLAGPAQAQGNGTEAGKRDDNSAEKGDPQSGFIIAKEHCARCHAIQKVGASPLPIAPPFRDLHLRYPVEQLDGIARRRHQDRPSDDAGIPFRSGQDRRFHRLFEDVGTLSLERIAAKAFRQIFQQLDLAAKLSEYDRRRRAARSISRLRRDRERPRAPERKISADRTCRTSA